MKNKFKGLGLCAVLLLACCSCSKTDDSVKANINNGNETIVSGLKGDVKNTTLQQLYDSLKANKGNELANDKLIEIIGELELLNDTTWKARYDARVEDKLIELAKSSDYEIDGVFSEELLVETLRSKLYSISCDSYGPTYDNDNKYIIDKYMLCDYTDYVNKEIKVSVIKELLNEKYVYDKVMKDKKDILTSKKIRFVEYISIDSTKEGVANWLSSEIEKLAADNSTYTLESIKDAWVDKLVDEINEEYSKIGTSDDANGSIFKDYTNGFEYDKSHGLDLKIQNVYDGVYYEKATISNNNKSILNTTLIEKLLDKDVLSDTRDLTIEINGSYYLVNPLADSSITSKDIKIKDAENSKYYIIKVSLPTYEESEINTSSDVYEAVKILANETTLVSDSLNYYLENNKFNIKVHDEEVYEYLKTQYPSIFVD